MKAYIREGGNNVAGNRNGQERVMQIMRYGTSGELFRDARVAFLFVIMDFSQH